MTPSRLLLFDIDGTLLSSGPTARKVFSEALVEVFGTPGAVETYRFEGKLDPLIVNELMLEAGIEGAIIAGGLSRALDVYLDRLEAVLALEKPTLKPGVLALIERVIATPGVVTALLTGNVERGARLKLTAADLWHHFSFGVWGDDGARRTELGHVALRRAREVTGMQFEGKDCVVIGDSTHDVDCGKALGARVIGVATGRTSFDQLHAAGADVVLSDFSDLTLTLEALLG
ncbi:MAG: HAD family hydrolase [Thermoanaerobaculia bacterium]